MDYAIVSADIQHRVADFRITPLKLCSDHCPLMLTMIATATKGPPQTQQSQNILEGTIRPTRTHVTQGPLHYEKIK